MNAMKLPLWPLVLCVVLTLPGARAFGRPPHTPDVPECVSVRNATQRSGYGYDQIVYVRNGCTVTVECTVGTRRNPKPEFRLVVPPGTERGVVTGTHEKKRHSKSWVTCRQRAEA